MPNNYPTNQELADLPRLTISKHKVAPQIGKALLLTPRELALSWRALFFHNGEDPLRVNDRHFVVSGQLMEKVLFGGEDKRTEVPDTATVRSEFFDPDSSIASLYSHYTDVHIHLPARLTTLTATVLNFNARYAIDLHRYSETSVPGHQLKDW